MVIEIREVVRVMVMVMVGVVEVMLHVQVAGCCQYFYGSMAKASEGPSI